MKNLKIKSEKLGGYPIWAIRYNFGNRVDLYDRDTEEYKGLTKKEVEDIVNKRVQDGKI